ncbi:hypothetical protein HAPAU_37420 [Halalkalicoccus paucihalophilus]|uniref:Uncharacterized protein n=1 Tax=Halalkalicoccus paucihalophilus TaxID=1008153 RepID=A0A151A918_9EURY|nr:hypothetical protein HAPAU_37420 [Halalkalicoccus paucihalophilus]
MDYAWIWLFLFTCPLPVENLLQILQIMAGMTLCW